MTITLRRSAERAHASEDGGGDRWTTFVPAGLRDAPLELLVEHDLAPGTGFRVDAPKDTELVTYVEEGAVIYGEARGRTSRLRAGEFRRTSSRGGITHRAINKSLSERAHVFQSGLASDPKDLSPGGEQKRFPLAERKGLLRLVASPDGRDGSLRIHQDVRLYSSLLDRGTHVVYEFSPARRGWLHVVAGRILLGEDSLVAGDGVGLADEVAVSFRAQEASEILLFDLP